MAKKTPPKPEQPDLPSILKDFADCIRRSSLDLANPYAVVLECGQFFPTQAKPKGIRWGKRKRCYENAYDLMSRNATFTYCEGYVLVGTAPIPCDHAWCIDDAGNVVDNTLRDTAVAYFGIPFDMMWAMRRVIGGAESLVDELLLMKKVPKTAIAKAYRK